MVRDARDFECVPRIYPGGLSLRLDALGNVTVPDTYASYVKIGNDVHRKSPILQSYGRTK